MVVTYAILVKFLITCCNSQIAKLSTRLVFLKFYIIL